MELPPAIQIVFQEELWKCASPQELLETLKSQGLLKELAIQAKWSVDEFEFADSSSVAPVDEFTVTPSDTINPFSPIGKCAADDCLAESTDDFVKLVGLYSDVAIIPDPLTNYFAVEDRLGDYSAYRSLLSDLQTLNRLKPLIEAGVLRFADPVHRYCLDCKEGISKAVKRATEAILSSSNTYEVELSGSRKQPILFLRSPDLQSAHSHPLLTAVPLKRSQLEILGAIGKSGQPTSHRGKDFVRKIIARRIKNDVSSVFFDLATSRKANSLFLAGTRPEALIINEMDRLGPALAKVEDWEAMRTVHLPWVYELTADEVLKLRDEAGIALPRLRELLRQRLVDPTASGTSTVKNAVADLRAQTLEVQSELDGLGLPRERNFRAGMLGLAVSFVVYALATQSPTVVATSVGALLGTLAHVRKTEREQANKRVNLVSTPAYALLKAKEILGQRK